MRHRILANTALALIFVVPLGGVAKNSSELAAAPVAAPAPLTFAERASVFAAFGPSISIDDVRTLAAAAPADSATAIEQAAPAAATEQAAPVDPLAKLDPADRAVAEKMRDLIDTKLDKLFASKKEREAVAAFYQNRNLAPLWLDKGVENARAASVIARLKSADTEGLEPSDYRQPSFTGLGPDALAEAELKLTRTLLTYARHLQAGRFPYTRVSRNIELPQAAPEPADILSSHRECRRCRQGARRPQPAAGALSQAQGDARGAAQQAGRQG